MQPTVVAGLLCIVSPMRTRLAGLLLFAACGSDDSIIAEGGGGTTSDASVGGLSSGVGTSDGAPPGGPTSHSSTGAADSAGSSGAEGDGSDPGSSTGSGSTGREDRASESSGTATGDVQDRPEPVFERVTEVAGVDMPHIGSTNFEFPPGIGWRDMDGDGHLDLLLTSFEGPSRLWLGDGAGFFTTAGPGWLDGFASTGVAIGDYDNDGTPDVYVSSAGPNALLRGGSGFANVAVTAGVADSNPGTVAAWADYDGDGDLDLYSGAWDAEFLVHSTRLYENLGDGTFNDVTSILDPALAGRPVLAASFLDYDNDGDSDLYVVIDKNHGNILWRNDGPGCGGWCFVDAGPETGADLHIAGMGVAIADYDNDGDLDLYVTDIVAGWLLQNQAAQGEPVFQDVTAEAGVDLFWVGWGTTFFDYDNDGWPDLYVGLGTLSTPQHNILFHNLGDGTFQPLGTSSGANDPGFTQPVAYADFDEDGFVDIAVGNREDRYELYRNRGHYGTAHSWLQIELHGGGPVASDAAGARVSLKGEPGPPQLQEVKLGSSQSSTNMRALHFGLGESTTANFTVTWPNGTTHAVELQDGQLEQRLTVTYPDVVEGL